MPEGFISIEPFMPPSYDYIAQASREYMASLNAEEADPLLPTAKLYDFHVKALANQHYAKVYRITYKSGGYLITGMLVTPSEMKDKAHPLILFNRGGNRAFGALNAGTALRYLLPLSRRNNALVFASNYRGGDGSEGRDEYCGAEVEDVLALLEIARAHPGWDGKHSLMMGWSRGAAMTFRAIKQGARIGAAVAVAGITDFWMAERDRREMREVFRQMMPDFEARREEHYFARSAVRWPEALTVPLLLMHGGGDRRANISETAQLAALLAARGLPHAFIAYPGDDHGLTHNYEDVMARAGEWMVRHAEV